MSDRFWEDETDTQEEQICDIIMTPDKSSEISCMKPALFTMEDKTIVCEEHRDMLVETDGLEWTPGVNREED